MTMPLGGCAITPLDPMPAPEKLKSIYRMMVACREFEDRLYNLFLTENMPGTMHQYTGQEAVAVGVCAALRPDDYITSTHRGHGHAVAKGVPLRSMMAEMFAKDGGCCRGMGGSMHITDPDVGMLGATGIVGGGIPIATGAALSAQMRGSDQVAVSFFGDGAINIGGFHESLNQAGIWKLPVIYVCENNFYAFSVAVERAAAITNLADRAAAYGFSGIAVDGNDVLAVYAAARTAVERARRNEGPTLIECKTYRQRGHSRFEKANYRSAEEVKQWITRDPIPRFRQFLIEQAVLSEEEAEQIRQAVLAELVDAVSFARQSPEPPPDAALHYVFSTGRDPLSP